MLSTLFFLAVIMLLMKLRFLRLRASIIMFELLVILLLGKYYSSWLLALGADFTF
jgi:hypothetical protein